MNIIKLGRNKYGKISNKRTQKRDKEVKEETMEKNAEQLLIYIPKGYEFFGINDDNKIVLTKKQSKYPKTGFECCKVLDICPYNELCIESSASDGYLSDLEEEIYDKIFALNQLIICRNAYWKIAGEQMGLDKPWEPDYSDTLQVKYTICYSNDKILCSFSVLESAPLSFPTEEMRDAFYENFKVLIEACKELL